MNDSNATALDKWDVTAAIASGAVSAGLDFFLVGSWDFKSAKIDSNKFFNEKVQQFAMKDPEYAKKYKDTGIEGRQKSYVSFLEGKYHLPGDGEYKIKGSGVSASTHHLDDDCHHPTLKGLISCISVQFSENATYHPSKGEAFHVKVQVNQYDKFVSDNSAGKVFCGVLNWFITVAKTISNREGHLYSDMIGSRDSVGKGNDGMGLPGFFLSTAKEMSDLKCFKNEDFSDNLRKAYCNGIGTGKSQVDLGAFNALFEGASSKLDMRTEHAIESELARQAVPIAINEMIVRSVYFIKRFIYELKQKESVLQLTTEDWTRIIPFNNNTISHMLIVSSATFSVVDISVAGINAAVKNKGNKEGFVADFVKGINYCGVGRLALAVADKGRLALADSYKEYLKLAENKIIALTERVPDSEQTLKAINNAGNMAVAVLSAGTPLGFVSASIGVYQQIADAVKDLELSHEERIRVEAECAQNIAIIRENRKEMELCVSEYMSEHLQVFSTALDEMDTAIANNDTDGFIGGNAKIQKKLGSNYSFSTQDEFEDIMSSEDAFKM